MTPDDRVHHWPVRVYYEDTDFSGVVYHANYLRFFERGRTEFLRHAGIDQAALFAAGQAFAVRAMSLDFRSPARMDDLLSVDSAVAMVGGASITMVQSIRRGEAVLVAATVRIGLVVDGRAARLPRALVDKLRPAEMAPQVL